MSNRFLGGSLLFVIVFTFTVGFFEGLTGVTVTGDGFLMLTGFCILALGSWSSVRLIRS